jgi:transketolase
VRRSATFEVLEAVRSAWDANERGAAAEAEWGQRFEAYRAAHPELAAELERRLAGDLPADWVERSAAEIAALDAETPKVATRKASQMALERFGPLLPEFFGGSADLTGSNLTAWSGSRPYGTNALDGNYHSFGVREFGMAAIANGMALHGGLVPYVGTFLVFSDYARNAIRMAALMRQRVIHVLTHDSIGLGEDGPTHQPIEHVASLRLIPNVEVWRPCDAVETAVAWQQSIERADGPSCLALTRQGVPHQPRDAGQRADIARGGYVLRDCDGTPEVILIATGSEVQLVVAAADSLSERRVRVVSMPCVERFAAQDAAYREAVLPAAVGARVAVEAGVTQGWYRYVGSAGEVVGIDRFGASAPAGELFENFGFTAEAVAAAAERVLAG